jgi:hypothetical protein
VALDITDTIISQYGTSPRITALIDFFAAWFGLDPFDLFFNDLWNIDTAVGYGLDVWGRILNFPRPAVSGEPADDDTYRHCLIAQAYLNITSSSIKDINAFLRDIYGSVGIAYIVDSGGMAMQYHFGAGVPDWLQAVIDNGLLPRPSGVGVTFSTAPGLGTESGDTITTEGGATITVEG